MKKFIVLLAVIPVLTSCKADTNNLETKAAMASTEMFAKETLSNKSTPLPTNSPKPSETPAPTATPKPTESPMPINTPAPTETPDPVKSENLPGVQESTEQTPQNLTDMPQANPKLLPQTQEDSEIITVNTASVTNDKKSWYFVKNKEHKPPSAQNTIDIDDYNAYYLGDIEEKTIYLTFDCGYENGFTPKILDVLKEKNVPAAFFLTKPYIKNEPELVKRMIDEGHLPCNHSVNHKSSPDLTAEQLTKEINDLAEYFNEQTGYDMPKFFRPPMGEYSERTLAATYNLGYKTIFWSFAYKDWIVKEQPGKAVAYKTVVDNWHNGEIMLLHAVSQSNTEALADIIDNAREQGYEFKSLYDLPVKKSKNV